MKSVLVAVVLGAALVAPAAADRAEDDLAAVRRALGAPAAETRVAQARPPAEAGPPRVGHEPTRGVGARDSDADEAPRAERRRRTVTEPRWLRVRISEKGRKGSRLAVNLPLVFVRTIAEDWPIQGCRRCEHGGPTLGDVLRTLDSGQSLVELDDEETTIRVWVD